VLGVISSGAWICRSGKRGLACILLSCFGLAVCEQPANTVSTAAQSESRVSASGEADRSSTKIRVNTDLVVIPVTVTDGKGQIVNGLQKEHFTLYEDKVEQAITHFAAEDAPVAIGLVFDTSDSMAPKLRKAQEAVAALLRNANPEDEFFLVQFNYRPQLAVSMTKRTEEIQNRVTQVRTRGSTALLDAVTLALKEMRNAHHTRKAIIIISDGEDNASYCSPREVKEAVRQAQVLVYAIGITDSSDSYQTWRPEKPPGSALLDEIAKESGGRLFEVSRLKQLPDIACKIGAWLRNQYVLAYAPSNTENDGRYHNIQVKITKPKGFPRLHAFWRLGYYAPAE
jgi:Ca-activated chloride channel family protein